MGAAFRVGGAVITRGERSGRGRGRPAEASGDRRGRLPGVGTLVSAPGTRERTPSLRVFPKYPRPFAPARPPPAAPEI